MTFHICGQCAYFVRDEQLLEEDEGDDIVIGICYAFPPTVYDGEHSARPLVDSADRACAVFKAKDAWR